MPENGAIAGLRVQTEYVASHGVPDGSYSLRSRAFVVFSITFESRWASRGFGSAPLCSFVSQDINAPFHPDVCKA